MGRTSYKAAAVMMFWLRMAGRTTAATLAMRCSGAMATIRFTEAVRWGPVSKGAMAMTRSSAPRVVLRWEVTGMM